MHHYHPAPFTFRFDLSTTWSDRSGSCYPPPCSNIIPFDRQNVVNRFPYFTRQPILSPPLGPWRLLPTRLTIPVFPKPSPASYFSPPHAIPKNSALRQLSDGKLLREWLFPPLPLFPSLDLARFRIAVQGFLDQWCPSQVFFSYLSSPCPPRSLPSRSPQSFLSGSYSTLVLPPHHSSSSFLEINTPTSPLTV